MSQKPGRTALLALGMHRSGTSALTGALAQLGVQLGERLYAPQEGVNDKGFFEHSDITECNDRILLTLGSGWDDILPLPEGWHTDVRLNTYRIRLRRHIHRDFSEAPLWALKDPRICRLLPLWQGLLREAGADVRYLLIVRHPMEVARSLARRDDFSTDKALLLWLEHNLQLEYHSRGHQRLVTAFDDLLDDPTGQLERVRDGLGLDLPVADKAADVVAFLSPQLRHHAAVETAADGPLAQIALAVYDALRRAATTGQEPDVQTLDQARQQLDDYRAAFPALLVEHLRTLAQQRGNAQVMVERVFASWSWKLGKPLRFLERLTGGDI